MATPLPLCPRERAVVAMMFGLVHRQVAEHPVARSALPADAAAACDIWLACPSGVPGEVGDNPDDCRLGLCLAGLRLDDGAGASRAVALDDPLLCAGFHRHQGDHRWTAGRARLPAALLAGLEGTVFLRLDLHTPPLPRWVAPEVGMEAETEVAAGSVAA